MKQNALLFITFLIASFVLSMLFSWDYYLKPEQQEDGGLLYTRPRMPDHYYEQWNNILGGVDFYSGIRLETGADIRKVMSSLEQEEYGKVKAQVRVQDSRGIDEMEYTTVSAESAGWSGLNQLTFLSDGPDMLHKMTYFDTGQDGIFDTRITHGIPLEYSILLDGSWVAVDVTKASKATCGKIETIALILNFDDYTFTEYVYQTQWILRNCPDGNRDVESGQEVNRDASN